MAVQLAAPLFLDILWPFFLLLGWEQVRSDPGNTGFSLPPSYVRTDTVWPAIIAEAIFGFLGAGGSNHHRQASPPNPPPAG